MMNQWNIRRVFVFSVVFAFAFCAVFVFAAEVRANGNPYADAPPPAAVEPSRKPPQRAPVRRPARQRRPAAQQQTVVKPKQPSSLETGIKLMEQMRYEQARPWLQKAVQEERNNPYAWYWYGKAHDSVGQFNQAQFFYTRALALDPTFPPLSRVVVYPNEGDRIPLWDPLRPARIYPVEVGSSGVEIVPPGSQEATSRPVRPPVDPNLPQVPVYVPPEFPSPPGDAVQPPVYVPPSPPPAQEADAPVYIPPPPSQ